MADDPTTEPDNDEPEPQEPQDQPEPEEEPDDDAAKQEPKPAPKPAPPKTASKQPIAAEFEALQKKVRDLNRENADRRKKLEQYERERETEQDKAIREAVEAARSENKPRIVAAEAKVALLAAEARPERVTALTKFLDLDKIEIDGDDVTGLEDQVAALRDEYPEFFRQPEPAPKKPSVPKVPGKSQPAADEPRSIGERVMAARRDR